MTTNTLTGERKLSETVSLSIKGKVKINIDKHLDCVASCRRISCLRLMKKLFIVFCSNSKTKRHQANDAYEAMTNEVSGFNTSYTFNAKVFRK